MTDWRFWNARRRGTLVAQTLARAWCSSPPALTFPVDEFALVARVLLDSPAASLAWNKLRIALPEGALHNQFRDAYRFSNLRAEIGAADLKAILEKLRAVDVEPIVHKGWATARLYPSPGLRAYSDIDLLIRPDELPKARAALQTLPPNTCPVDLIHSEITELDLVNWDGLYGRSRRVEFEEATISVLGPEDHLRSLCIHGLKHGFASPLWLVDVAVTMEAVPSSFDWDLCIGSREPQANWVRSALALAHRLLQADIQGTPVGAFLPQLPGWVVRSVLRRWSRPPVPDPLPRFASVLRRRTGILEALAWRWPSACQTAVDAKAPLTSVPGIHLQLRSVCAPAKLKVFFSELSAVWREARQSPSGTQHPRD